MPKQQEKRFDGVTVEWLDWPGRYLPPERTVVRNCSVVDSGGSMVTILLPDEEEPMRKRKDAKGLKINGTAPQWFFQCPSKYMPAKMGQG